MIRSNTKLISLTATTLFAAALLGGCASTESVKQAQDTADQALNKANAAQACCDANQARLDRMYQKIMSK